MRWSQSSPSIGQEPSAAWSSASWLGGLQEGFAVLDVAGRDGGCERRGECDAGQALVAERAFAAVMVPAARVSRASAVVSARASPATGRPAWAA